MSLLHLCVYEHNLQITLSSQSNVQGLVSIRLTSFLELVFLIGIGYVL